MEKIVVFATPVSIGGKLLNSVSMRPTTMGDEEDAQALAVELGRPLVPLTSEMCLFSALTGISYDDLRNLRPSNYERIRAAYRELNAARPTNPENGLNEGPDLRNLQSQDAAESTTPPKP